MAYAVLLAGGSGSRLKSSSIPKQFITLNGRSILEHVVEKFLISNRFSGVVVVVPSFWLQHSQDILSPLKKIGELFITEGGETRQDSLYKGVKFLIDNVRIEKREKIISHDVARPFVTLRIIDDNISSLDKYDAVDTVIPATDTIVQSSNQKDISSIPMRSEMYQGQTPQSFFAEDFIQIYDNTTTDIKNMATDAMKLFLLKNKRIGLVEGDTKNIKITSDFDLQLAKLLLNID